jgi:hypothetical protein
VKYGMDLDVLESSGGENFKNLAEDLLPHVKSEALCGLSLARKYCEIGSIRNSCFSFHFVCYYQVKVASVN